MLNLLASHYYRPPNERLFMFRVLLSVLVAVSLIGCARNVNTIKARASSRLSEFGYQIVAYEGYQGSFIDGGHVWYQVRKKNDRNDVRYTLYLTLWNSELHLYGPVLIDKNLITAAAQGESPAN